MQMFKECYYWENGAMHDTLTGKMQRKWPLINHSPLRVMSYSGMFIDTEFYDVNSGDNFIKWAREFSDKYNNSFEITQIHKLGYMIDITYNSIWEKS